MQNISHQIIGPFGWPKLENGFEPLPSIPGVYLMTVEYKDGYLPYGVGVTRRPMRKRFLEHTRSYVTGNYNILDLDAAKIGKREVTWKGWGWTPQKLADYEARKDEVVAAAHRQMLGTRIFILNMGVTPRLLERMEASIANHFYKAEDILFDRGMLCMARWKTEEPLRVVFQSTSKLYGLPSEIVI